MPIQPFLGIWLVLHVSLNSAKEQTRNCSLIYSTIYIRKSVSWLQPIKRVVQWLVFCIHSATLSTQLFYQTLIKVLLQKYSLDVIDVYNQLTISKEDLLLLIHVWASSDQLGSCK
jgi:hypothetical protein